jgi:molecular chaperone DnaK
MLALDANEKDYINSIIIRKSSKINKEFSKEYTFAGDKLEVYVLQGESRDPYETDIIGKYVITGMTKGQKNIIVVNFLYNTNGVVEVNASIKNGKRLTAVRESVTEDMSALIARLEREREETKQASRRVEIMLVIDTSGSMTCGGRMPVAKESAKGFIDQFSKSSNVFISVVAFADYSEYACKWSQNPAQLHRAIDKIESVSVGGATSARPIEDRYKQYSKDTVKIMVILTDGFWDHQEAEIASAAKAKKDDVIIYAIGIGEADEDFLNKVSSGLGKKVELGDLTKTFKEVAISIATEVADGKLK